jgi:hypothetical protein
MIGRPGRCLWSLAASLAVALGSSGCLGGDDMPRQPLSGLVKLNGKPLAKGVIFFTPAGKLVSGVTVQGAGMIRNGRFSIRRAYGLTPGKYRIAVHAGGTRKERPNSGTIPGKVEAVNEDLIPSKYNSRSELEIEINDAPIKELTVDLR